MPSGIGAALVLGGHREVLCGAHAALEAAALVAVDREREEQRLLALVRDLVVGDLDDQDLVAVAGVPVLARPGLVGAGGDGELAVVVGELEDRDPARVLLRQVGEAVLVLAEALRVRQVLDVRLGEVRLGEDPAAARSGGRAAHVPVGADGRGARGRCGGACNRRERHRDCRGQLPLHAHRTPLPVALPCAVGGCNARLSGNWRGRYPAGSGRYVPKLQTLPSRSRAVKSRLP